MLLRTVLLRTLCLGLSGDLAECGRVGDLAECDCVGTVLKLACDVLGNTRVSAAGDDSLPAREFLPRTRACMLAAAAACSKSSTASALNDMDLAKVKSNDNLLEPAMSPGVCGG